MLKQLLSGFSELAYGAMRAVLAFLYLCHGLQKLGAFGGHFVPLLSLLGAAAVIETLMGPLIGVGLFTPIAAFIASGELAVAYFRVHMPRGGLPIQNGGELAVAYCFAFLYIATRGGGR